MSNPPEQCKYCLNPATAGGICDGADCRVQEEVMIGVIARFECKNMADASFQQWLDATFPELSTEMREIAIDHYRSGTLLC